MTDLLEMGYRNADIGSGMAGLYEVHDSSRNRELYSTAEARSI